MSYSPRSKQKAFLQFLFGDQQGYLCIVTIDRTKKKDDKSRVVQNFYRYPDNLDNALTLVDRSYLQKDVYFCVHLLSEEKRQKKYALPPQALWADVDTCPVDELLKTPTLLLESSPGKYQAFWKLAEPFPASEVEEVNKRIAYYHAPHGMDTSGHDLTQLLRVPLTMNHKYSPPQTVKIANVQTERIYHTGHFKELYPALDAKGYAGEIPFPDELPSMDGDTVIAAYQSKLNPRAVKLYEEEPEGNWSKALWELELCLMESGIPLDEAFIVARDAACNKFARDNRPEHELWADLVRAHYEIEAKNSPLPITDRPEYSVSAVIKFSPILTDEERARIAKRRTLVEEYIEWASSVTDASSQYHQAAVFIVLSTLLAGRVTLPTSFGTTRPNLWFMILGDTAQPYNSPILTPKGWTQMGQLKVGDKVIGSNGKPTTVLAINERGMVDNYRVTFVDGSSTECSADHLWTCRPDSSKHEQALTTEELQTRLNCWKPGMTRPRVPILSGPVQYDLNPALPLDPYILGIWLGEGCRSPKGQYVEFASSDDHIVEEVRRRLPVGMRLVNYGSNKWSWHIKPEKRLGPNPVRDALRGLNLISKYSGERAIPQEYLTASVQDRLDLLRGLMDGEGSVIGGNCDFQSTSSGLTTSMVELCRSLGFRVQMSETKRRTTAGNKIWRIKFSCTTENMIPFSMPRKVETCRHGIQTRNRSWGWKGIKSIEALDQETMMRCIVVSASDQLYVTQDFTVTHNTLTRKSTAMDMAMDILTEIEPSALLATDGSIEGLLTALSTRAGRPSLFLRDEFTGLLEMIAKRDYFAGMLETLTKLYDGRYQKRVLRKAQDSIEIERPIFNIFAGGIKDKTIDLLEEKHITSGFVPRFAFVMGETDLTKIKPVGPPTTAGIAARTLITKKFRKLRDYYNSAGTEVDTGEHRISLPKTWEAQLTPEAWRRYNTILITMQQEALESSYENLISPCVVRLAETGLKVALLIAATQAVGEGEITIHEEDILHAFYYVEQWRENTLQIVEGAGSGPQERKLMSILTYIRERPGIPRQNIMRRFKLNARKGDEYLATLEERGLIIKERTGKGKGHTYSALEL